MKTIFFGGTVFIGNGEILDNAIVEVDNERIVNVSFNKKNFPKKSKKIEITGCTLLPGFIDCHVHLCLDSSADIAKSLKFSK